MGGLKGESMCKPLPLPQAVRLKPKRKKHKQIQNEGEEDEEETNSNKNNNDNDVVLTAVVGPTDSGQSGEVTGPLSLLRKFPNNSSNNLNHLAPAATRELYAKTAESLKKLLVSELLSPPWSGDLETMVASANRAFKALDWLQPDYADFYHAVRSFLSRRAQLSSVESDLRTHLNEESDAVSSLQARLKEAAEAGARSEAEYWKAIDRNSGLKSRVMEIQKVLKTLEFESAWIEKVVLPDRKREWDQCLESHLAIMKEEIELAKQMEEKQKTIERLRDEAEAGVQGSIKALSSLC